MLDDNAGRDPVQMNVDSNGGLTLANCSVFTGRQRSVLDKMRHLRECGGKHLIVTPNVDQVITLQRDPEFRSVYERASVRLLDGMPLVRLGRVLSRNEVSRNTGTDLLPACVDAAPVHKWRVAIAGGSADVSEAAAERLRRCQPLADVHAVAFPLIRQVTDGQSQAVVDELRSLKPDIVFLCLGSPKQELWYSYWRSLLPDGVYVAAGAAADFAAGARIRAPEAIQYIGLEWLWRVVQEPRRLGRRYLLTGPHILPIVWRSIRSELTRRRSMRLKSSN
jgi:N-acetylglucosaminyldiphosphoundecaprenol N-acetyl-beta-D-mannosaminyltransferase